MVLRDIAYGLSGLVGLGIVFIGARFLLAPHKAAAAYGVAVDQDSAADAYLAVKGVRDIASGLFAFILIGARATHALGWVLLAATIIPVGDSIIVLTHRGSKAIAYGIHAATAALLLVTSVLLLVSPA
jgi:hypothetical protein